MTEPRKPRVLLLDDDKIIVETWRWFLSDHCGCECRATRDHDAAIRQAHEFRPDAFLTGFNNLGPENGCETAAEVLKFLPQCQITVSSGSAAAAPVLEEYFQRGYDFNVLAKPVHPQELIAWAASLKLTAPAEALPPLAYDFAAAEARRAGFYAAIRADLPLPFTPAGIRTTLQPSSPRGLVRGAGMKTVRWIDIALLFFLAVSAIIGAIPMLADPHGTPWSMPQSLLQYSPFPSYLFPGIVLLAANGLLALWALWLALAKIPRYGRWTALQGFVLLGWLIVECIMIRMVAWPHYLYGAVALGLIAAGLLLWRDENRPASFGDSI